MRFTIGSYTVFAMKATQVILRLADELARSRSGFFTAKCPGAGDRDTNEYMRDLRKAALEQLGQDFSERRICGENKLAVDFYVPDERTVIEVALSLRNPQSEFERDVLKALMAKEEAFEVERLIFVCKPGGSKRLSAPAGRRIIEWVRKRHQLDIDIHDLPADDPMISDTALLTEAALARDWDRPEEDEAWSYLQSARSS